jgi:hemerythrin-like domain-containing protein
MTSDSMINFDEPIPEMIKRLESEHKKFELKLVEVKISVENNKIDRSTEIIRSISDKIIHHAVEEEARLMRVIMHKAKEESAESVKIIQEHNWVMNFLKNRMITLEKMSASSDPREYRQAKNDLNEIVNNLRNHFKEEEQVVFPLALRAETAG